MDVTASKEKIELRTGIHWVCTEGIVRSQFFIPSGCPMVDSRMITEHIKHLDQLLSEKRYPFLMDLTIDENVLSFDALKKWGQNKALNKRRIAEAYVVDNLADLMFLKQHIRLNDLEFPARVFQSINQSKEWLERFK